MPPPNDPGSYNQKKGAVQFGFDPSSGYFALTMAGSGDPNLVTGNQTTGFALAICPGDMWTIEFTLDPACHWQFADPAITFKNPRDKPYYQIVSNTPQKVVMTAKSTMAGPLPPPWPQQIHPFNLNVTVGQSASASYDLVFDPIVENPPPDPP